MTRATYGLLALFTLSLLSPARCRAQTVGPDGATGINWSWEQGTAPTWYVEEQRYGAQYIEAGIAGEDASSIQLGLKVFDWGFARQAADGSFPDGQATGTQYHSAMLFMESVARACLELKQYSPITYALTAAQRATYTAKIAQYAAGLELATGWLLSPSIASAGQKNDAPYTHRRFLDGAAFAEESALTGDAAAATAGDPLIAAGVALQLGPGWQAALTRNADGSVPPATLVAPGQSPPANAFQVISAVGVDPEKNGYDVSYQCVGLQMAERWFALSHNSALKAQVLAAVSAGLVWEETRTAISGVVDVTGSSRTGTELTLSGQVKVVDVPAVSGTFAAGSSLLSHPDLAVWGVRVSEASAPISDYLVANSGACSTNAALDIAASAIWSIGLQRAGADYIEAGIRHENAAQIQTGIAILEWGSSHQAHDGSFPGSKQGVYGAYQFLEAAARAVLDLQQYRPVTYSLDQSTYSAFYRKARSAMRATGRWLMRSHALPDLWLLPAGSPERCYLAAAALAQTGVAVGDTQMNLAADGLVKSALPMQGSGGDNPEWGVTDVNAQAHGALYAARYLACADSTAPTAAVGAMLKSAMLWEMARVAPNGAVVGAPTPAFAVIAAAFNTEAQLAADRRMAVYAKKVLYFRSQL